MILSTKLLYLVGILVFASYEIVVVEGSDDDEEGSLKQALFLVELLKSDFAKILRENANDKGELDANTTEDTNTTCALPLEDANSTTPLIEAEVTVIGASSVDKASTTTPPPTPVSQPSAPPMPPPYSNWPPMPMPGFGPPAGPGRQGQFPDENYRFPYRFNRRRMMPDYYYFDAPMKSRGNFRRLDNNDPPGGVGNDTATPQAEITTNVSTTSEATTTQVEVTTSTTTTILQTSRPTTPITKSATLSATELTTLSTNEPTSSSTTDPSTGPTTTSSSSSKTRGSSQTPNDPTTEPSTQRTKPRHRVGVRTHAPTLKARDTHSSKRKKKQKLRHVDEHHISQETTTTEKVTKYEDVEMSQAASELIKEFNGTKPENMTYILDLEQKISNPKSKKKDSTTMKIFLQGSSRLPVPLPENNAFCHSYPQNALCGSMM